MINYDDDLETGTVSTFYSRDATCAEAYISETTSLTSAGLGMSFFLLWCYRWICQNGIPPQIPARNSAQVEKIYVCSEPRI